MTNKLKQFWKYLNTSHGTYERGIEEPYGSVREYEQISNPTPLNNIILTSIILGVISLGALGIGSCSYNLYKGLELKRERFAKSVPDHGSLEYMLREKQTALSEISWMTQANKRFENDFYGKDIKHQKEKIKEIDKKVENFKKQIKMKVEKGYLNKNDEQWGIYSVIYENEPWWPKEPNSIKQ